MIRGHEVNEGFFVTGFLLPLTLLAAGALLLVVAGIAMLIDRTRPRTEPDVLRARSAVVREAGRRVLEMRHFDVQLMGGIVLHQGKIMEMKTGEGKTLAAALAVAPSGEIAVTAVDAQTGQPYVVAG